MGAEEFHLNAWIQLSEPELWLEITVRPENYPSLTVSVIKITDEALAKHVQTCAGMFPRKLAGFADLVKLDEMGYIADVEEMEELSHGG